MTNRSTFPTDRNAKTPDYCWWTEWSREPGWWCWRVNIFHCSPERQIPRFYYQQKDSRNLMDILPVCSQEASRRIIVHYSPLLKINQTIKTLSFFNFNWMILLFTFPLQNCFSQFIYDPHPPTPPTPSTPIHPPTNPQPQRDS